MKLNTFTTVTMPKKMGRSTGSLSKISFCKSGLIQLNKAACTNLALSPGDKIAIAQDEDDPNNWYLFKHKEGFELRGKDFERIGSLTFNHKILIQTFLDAFELPLDQTYSFLISGESTVIEKTYCWGILVNSNN
jgi:hypothetical protein